MKERKSEYKQWYSIVKCTKIELIVQKLSYAYKYNMNMNMNSHIDIH